MAEILTQGVLNLHLDGALSEILLHPPMAPWRCVVVASRDESSGTVNREVGASRGLTCSVVIWRPSQRLGLAAALLKPAFFFTFVADAADGGPLELQEERPRLGEPLLPVVQ